MLTRYSTIKFFFIFITSAFISFYNCQTYTLSQLDSINVEYWNKGELEAAAKFNLKALSNYEKQNDDEGIIATYINIANAFSYLNKNREGMEYLDMARKKIRNTDNPLLFAKLYGQYGNCYALLGLYHQSNKNFNKAIFYSKKIQDAEQKKRKIYRANAWKSYNFYKLGDADSARTIQFRNLKLFPENPSVYQQIAHSYITRKKHLDSAEYYLEKSLPLIEGNNLYNKIEILTSFGDLYMAKENFVKASEYFLKSLALSRKMKNKYSEKIINLRLSKTYKAMGDTVSSTEYFQNYSVLNNEIHNNEKRVVSLMVEKFIKEKEDEEKSKKQRLYLLIAAITLIFLFLIYFIQSKYLKNQKKKDEQLQEKSLEAKQLKKQVNNAFDKVIRLAKENDPFFLIRFKEVYSDFYEKLISLHPNLTEHDIKFCAYLRLNLTNKEIIQYENISLRTVESKKYRLKKKLCLATEINLNKWILEL